MRIPYSIYSKKEYWLWKSKIQSLKFQLRKRDYYSKKFLNEKIYQIKSTIIHIKSSIWSICKAVIVIVFLIICEETTSAYWNAHINIFPNWLLNLQKFIPKPTYPDDKDAIIELVSVIASVTGVILALFYPMLATIASTAYAKVHSSIRNLLLQEKETQGYLRRLTFLTAYSITVLLFLSFHFQVGSLILTFLVLYSFITLFGILKIGLGIFNFFEPSTLIRSVISNLIDTIKSVTTEGAYWNDKNFQAHNYKIAFGQIENLSLITNLSIKDDFNETSFKSIM